MKLQTTGYHDDIYRVSDHAIHTDTFVFILSEHIVVACCGPPLIATLKKVSFSKHLLPGSSKLLLMIVLMGGSLVTTAHKNGFAGETSCH